MSGWGAWAKSWTETIGEGLKEFTEQLTDDTDEVRKEAREKMKVVQETVGNSEVLGALAEVPNKLADVPNKIGEKIEGASLDRVMRQVETKLVQVEGSATTMLSKGVKSLQRGMEVGGLSAASEPATSSAATAAATQRFEERVRAMEADASSFTTAVSDPAAFAHWSKGFDLLEQTDRIDGLLKAKPMLKARHAALVPSAMAYGTFWTRYFYNLHVLHEREQKLELLKQRAASTPQGGKQAAPALSSWDFDDAFNDPPPRQVAQPSVVAAAGAAVSAPQDAKPKAKLPAPLKLPPTPFAQQKQKQTSGAGAGSSAGAGDVPAATPSATSQRPQATGPKAPPRAATPRNSSTSASSSSTASSSSSAAVSVSSAAGACSVGVSSMGASATGASTSDASGDGGGCAGSGAAASSEASGERRERPPSPPSPPVASHGADERSSSASEAVSLRGAAVVLGPAPDVSAPAQKLAPDTDGEQLSASLEPSETIEEVATLDDAQGTAAATREDRQTLEAPQAAPSGTATPATEACIDVSDSASATAEEGAMKPVRAAAIAAEPVPPSASSAPAALPAKGHRCGSASSISGVPPQRRATGGQQPPGSSASSTAASEEFSVVGSDSAFDDDALIQAAPVEEPGVAGAGMPTPAARPLPPPTADDDDDDDWADWE